MPFVSQKQRAYFNANRPKLEAQGVDVGEWNQASKGMKLPVRKLGGGLKRKQAPSGAKTTMDWGNQ